MNLRFFIGIFLVSAFALMYEITLSRVFSVTHFYHLSFLVISIALFGIAAGGTFWSISKGKGGIATPSNAAALAGASVIIAFLALGLVKFDPVKASVDYLHAATLLLYYVFLGLPFFFYGMLVSGAFISEQKQSGKIYFANLCL